MPLAIMLLQAAALATAAPVNCADSTARLLRSAGPQTRVVVTFTGSQESLLPLDEAVGPQADSTLFPIDHNSFVLTIQVRSSFLQPSPQIFADRICELGSSAGARFNGVMSFVRETKTVDGRIFQRERMTEALMPTFPVQ